MSWLLPLCQRLGVTSTRQDAEHGIQNRIHSLFKVCCHGDGGSQWCSVMMSVASDSSLPPHTHAESCQEIQG